LGDEINGICNFLTDEFRLQLQGMLNNEFIFFGKIESYDHGFFQGWMVDEFYEKGNLNGFELYVKRADLKALEDDDVSS
jgi:hypothetical protein